MTAFDRLRTDQRPDVVQGLELSAEQRAPGDHLRAVHDMYRGELEHLTRVTDAVESGVGDVADVRQAIHDLSLRRELATYGTLCSRFCRVLVTHHTIEDQHVFPAMRAAGSEYGAVADHLEHEHAVIHELLVELDGAVVAVLNGEEPLHTVLSHVRELERVLHSHFTYEETQLAEPLGIHGLPI